MEQIENAPDKENPVNKQHANRIRQIVEMDALRACDASYAPQAAPAPDQDYLGQLTVWCLRTRLKLNSLMEQTQINDLAVQFAGKSPLEQKPIVERWVDAYTFEWLAEVLRQEHQGAAVPLCHKIAARLRYPDRHPLNREYAASEAVGLAAAYPRHRHIVEGLYLATEDVLYRIAVLFGDESDVPFSKETLADAKRK